MEAPVNVFWLNLIEAERAAINTAYDKNLITDEARRRIERELDLEEASLQHGFMAESGAPGTAAE